MGRPFTRSPVPVALLAPAAFLLLTLAVGSGGASTPPREYEVKAAFLYNFARFVQWPAGTFSSPKEPLTLCIIGQDPFGPDLEETVKGRTAGDREISIRRLRDMPSGPNPAGSCQIAFVSSSEKKRLHSVIDGLNGSAVLTVGDSSGFAEAGMVINLYREGETVRFEINLDATDRAHLKISSALLGLARIVHDAGGSK